MDILEILDDPKTIEQLDQEIASLEGEMSEMGQRLRRLKSLKSILSRDGTVPQPQRECDTREYQARNSGRDKEVYALLESGMNMADIARTLDMNYARVTSIRMTWERKTGKSYSAVARYTGSQTMRLPDRPVDEDHEEDDDPPATPAKIGPTRSGVDTEYSPAELADFRRRVEDLLKREGPKAYSQVLKGAGLSPHQFNAVIKLADIDKYDGLWQMKIHIRDGE